MNIAHAWLNGLHLTMMVMGPLLLQDVFAQEPGPFEGMPIEVKKA